MLISVVIGVVVFVGHNNNELIYLLAYLLTCNWIWDAAAVNYTVIHKKWQYICDHNSGKC